MTFSFARTSSDWHYKDDHSVFLLCDSSERIKPLDAKHSGKETYDESARGRARTELETRQAKADHLAQVIEGLKGVPAEKAIKAKADPIITDEAKKEFLDQAVRSTKEVHETIRFQIDLQALKHIAKAKRVDFKLGPSEVSLAARQIQACRELAAAIEHEVTQRPAVRKP